MVISSNLSLIPYRQDDVTLPPVQRQMMPPERESGQRAMNRYDLSRRPAIRYHYIFTDDQNLTYCPNRCMEPSKVDQLGSRVDIYI
jgi:hypothetical protein